MKVAQSVLFDHRVPARMADVLDEWGAAVLKPRRGGWGQGVTLIDNAERLRDIIGYVKSTAEHSPDQGFFLERYYENDPNRWARITMINNEVAYGYRKVSTKFHDFGDGRLKVQDVDEKGGGVVLADLLPIHIEQAERASEALGLGLVGFDMIWTADGPIIVDENTSPGNYIDLYEEVGKDCGKLFADLGIAPANPETDRYMLCGSPQMLKDTGAILDGWGLSESRGGYQGEYAIERAFVEK